MVALRGQKTLRFNSATEKRAQERDRAAAAAHRVAEFKFAELYIYKMITFMFWVLYHD